MIERDDTFLFGYRKFMIDGVAMNSDLSVRSILHHLQVLSAPQKD